MSLLGRLLRRSAKPRHYYPFSERPYRGRYPVGLPGRDISFITNTHRRLAYSLPAVLPLANRRLQQYEDMRLYHPDVRPPLSLTSTRVAYTPYAPTMPEVPEILIPKNPFTWREKLNKRTGELTYERRIPYRNRFDNADKVIICLKRKMRREVMHAFGLAGLTGFKKPRFGHYSGVRC